MDFTLEENELEAVKKALSIERKRCQDLEEKLAQETIRRQQAEKQLQETINQNIDVGTIAKQRVETEEQVAQLKRELELMRCEREKIARQVETEQEFISNNLFKKLELASGGYDTSAAGSSRRTSRSSSLGGSFSSPDSRGLNFGIHLVNLMDSPSISANRRRPNPPESHH